MSAEPVARRPAAPGRRLRSPAFVSSLLGVAVAQALMATSVVAQRPAPARHPSELSLHFERWSPPTAEEIALPITGARSVYLMRDDLVPLVRLTLALPVGDEDDPAERVGLASMTAAMLRRGGTVSRTPAELDEAIDALGARLEVHGGESRTVATLVSLSEVFPEALDLLFEVLLEPRFDADRLARVRRALETGFASREDDPVAVLRRRWNDLSLGPDHPRSRQLTRASLARLDDVALHEFHRRHLLAEQPWIALSGAITDERARALLGEHLGRWSRRRAAAAELADADRAEGAAASAAADVVGAGGAQAPARRPPAPPGLYLLEHPAPQGKMMIGGPGVTIDGWADERLWTAMVLQEILDGGGVLSRLRSRLRARDGLVYTVQGLLEAAPRDALLEIFLEAEPPSAIAALRAVVDELEELAARPVGAEELELAQQGLVQRYPFHFADAEAIAGRYAQDDLLGRSHEHWAVYRDEIDAVSARQVQALAREVLDPERLRVLWVGPPLDDRLLREVVGRGPLVGEVTRLPRLDPATLEPLGSP
ncbi:MAG: insulinase family protein [Acidobacteria bacterium]|nr:MAG: insulinase family protein [Acidobacteriota bacterium]REK00507.1 MAG: insulinase family protein [Acidobacteriota bacterium]